MATEPFTQPLFFALERMIDNTHLESDEAGSKPASRGWLKKEWLGCLLLALIGFVVRSPALQGQFIWDDQYIARDNPLIKSPLLILETFRHHLFLESYSAHYRPVQNISLMFDYAFWNANSFGFHLTNVLLHVGGGVLLYFLLRRLLASLGMVLGEGGRASIPIVALLLAGIWMVHPVHSAAVDYISGRADSLAFVFACSGWLLFLRGQDAKPRWVRLSLFVCAALSGLLALCSRETACIWLAIFILHALLFDRQLIRRRKVLTIICCTVVLLIYAGLRQLPERRSGPGPSNSWDAPVRTMLMLRALGDYARLLIFPTNLHMERTVFNVPNHEDDAVTLEYLSVAGFLFAGVMAWLAFRRGHGQRLRAFGASWFLLAFLPISNLVDLNATVAEHWLYLPSVGFLIFIAGCVCALPRRYERAAVVIAGLAVLGLGARSFVRSTDWVDPATFYQRTAESGGTSCRVAVNLAQIYITQGQAEKAERLLRNVLKNQPDYTIARNNLADALIHLGKKEEAETILKDATAAAHNSRNDYPRTWIASMNFARTLDLRGDGAGALAVIEKARVDYPNTWELISCQSELLRRAHKIDDAIKLVRAYTEAKWWHYGAAMAMGRLLAEKGEANLAENALSHAAWLDVRSTEALNLIALIRVRENRLSEALQTQNRAVSRQPEEPRQYILLSDILDKMGRGDEARLALAQVTRLRTIADSGKLAN